MNSFAPAGRTTTKTRLAIVIVAAGLLSSCSMFDWMSGDRSNSKTPERYDDAPITVETGSIPGDRSNAEYTGEELRAD